MREPSQGPHPTAFRAHALATLLSGGLVILVALWGTLAWASSTPVVDGEGFGALNFVLFPMAAFVAHTFVSVVVFLPLLSALRWFRTRFSIPGVAFWLVAVAILVGALVFVLVLAQPGKRWPGVPGVVWRNAMITVASAFVIYGWLVSNLRPQLPRHGPRAA